MTQFAFNNLDELIKFIDDDSINLNQMNLQLIDSYNVNHITQIIVSQTLLPEVLIKIIFEYLQSQIIVKVIKNCFSNCITTYKRYYHVHFKFEITNNISNINFALTHCFYFRHHYCYVQLEHKFINGSLYDTFSCCSVNDDILKRELLTHSQSFDNCDKKIYAANRLIFLTNALINPNKYFTTDRKFNDNFCDVYGECKFAIDDNIFFNCYNANMHQNHNIIQNNNQCVNINNYSNRIEICKCCDNSNNYNYVFVRKFGAGMVEYEIKNHEKLIYIITINKLLYDIINERIMIKENEFNLEKKIQ